MPTAEQILAGGLVVVTLAIAIVFGVRQYRQLHTDGPDADEVEFHRRSARRRLFASVLLGIVAILLAANYVTGLDRQFLKMGDERAQQQVERPMQPEERATFRQYTLLWIAVLLLLLTIVITIGFDMIGVRRHWRQSMDRLRNDRREMMEEQLSRLRAERGYRTNDE